MYSAARRSGQHGASRESLGLPPVDFPNARVLVLGSFPSRASLEKKQYYGHPRNHFWTILGACLGIEVPPDYPGRLELLAFHGIALWDAAASCVRPGSLDSDIRDPKPSPLPAFLAERPTIRIVVFNGSAAAALFAAAWAPELKGLPLGEIRHLRPFSGEDALPADGGGAESRIAFARLPSSSPVPTGRFRGAADKVESWSKILNGPLAEGGALSPPG